MQPPQRARGSSFRPIALLPPARLKDEEDDGLYGVEIPDDEIDERTDYEAILAW